MSLADEQGRELLEIGYVARAHGLRGELRVKLHWDESDALDTVQSVVLAKPPAPGVATAPRRVKVLGARRTPQGYLLIVEGVDDKEAADALRGFALYATRAELPELEEGEYYLSDLIGFEVWNGSERVGSVVDLRLHPSVDCVVVKTSDGTRLEQPLLEPWLKAVDVKERRVELTSLDGIIEQ